MNRCRGSKDLKPEARFFVDPIELAKSATRGDAGSQLVINFLPVFGLDGVVVYVAQTAFPSALVTDSQLLEIAQRLTIAKKPQPA